MRHSASSLDPGVSLQCCSRYLQSSEEEEGAVVQSLCALVLLEGSSPRQVFTRFLLARKVGATSCVCVCVCVCVCEGGIIVKP